MAKVRYRKGDKIQVINRGPYHLKYGTVLERERGTLIKIRVIREEMFVHPADIQKV